MGGLVGILVGLPLAVFGFMVMRNPMRLALLSPITWGRRLLPAHGSRHHDA
jgi:hypothetical protein